jgi:hypothetical protein
MKVEMPMQIAEVQSLPAVEREASISAVSWGAVIGGAFVSAALSLILLALGAGFGLSTVSPWSNFRTSAAAAGAVAVIWLLVTQVIASGLGGYLTGRLRVRWHRIHGDEVHFRDTANGFLAWAVALVMTVAFLAAEAASLAGGLPAADPKSLGPTAEDANAYYVDRLFRADRAAAPDDLAVRAEASRIFNHALLANEPSTADNAYLAELVAARTGVSMNDANRRVSSALADARQSEDDARKAVAHLLLWLFLSLLTGAFCASYAATIGGRQRDHVQFA